MLTTGGLFDHLNHFAMHAVIASSSTRLSNNRQLTRNGTHIDIAKRTSLDNAKRNVWTKSIDIQPWMNVVQYFKQLPTYFNHPGGFLYAQLNTNTVTSFIWQEVDTVKYQFV